MNGEMYQICCIAAAVFGAMGSWNDPPLCMAHEKGMDDEGRIE